MVLLSTANIQNALYFLKYLNRSIKIQLSASVSSAISFFIFYNELGIFKIPLIVLFLLATCMSLGSAIEKIVQWRESKKKKHQAIMKRKSGFLGSYQFTDILNDVWLDQNYSGLAWEILINIHTSQAFLREPVCSDCRTNLIRRTNMNCDGFYIECTDCSKKFDVNDIGEKRALANASLQGEVRRNPHRFFRRW
jgi:hypothetical protein